MRNTGELLDQLPKIWKGLGSRDRHFSRLGVCPKETLIKFSAIHRDSR